MPKSSKGPMMAGFLNLDLKASKLDILDLELTMSKSGRKFRMRIRARESKAQPGVSIQRILDGEDLGVLIPADLTFSRLEKRETSTDYRKFCWRHLRFKNKRTCSQCGWLFSFCQKCWRGNEYRLPVRYQDDQDRECEELWCGDCRCPK